MRTYPAPNETPCHEDIWGSGGIDPCILNLSTRLRWSGSLPGHFTPGERAPVTNWLGGWLDHRTGLDMVMKRSNPLPLPGLQSLVIQPAASHYTDWATLATIKYHTPLKPFPKMKPQICYRCHINNLTKLLEKSEGTTVWGKLPEYKS